MPITTPAELVPTIHASQHQLVLAVSGGGSGAIAELLQVPGASRSVLEAAVPYSTGALTRWLGAKPEQFCSEATARAMAMAAWTRARSYDPREDADGAVLIGLACTASLASDRPKRGDHRVYLAAQTTERTIVRGVILQKGRTRLLEEQLASAMILNLAAEVCGVEGRLELNLEETERIESAECVAPAAWRDLLLGRQEAVRRTDAAAARHVSAVIFPGAFNPLHRGHREMAELAAARLKRPVEYEIAVQNVDKPPLDYLEIKRRIDQFAPQQAVWLTTASTFVQKSQLFPGATFIVGADTITRIADPKYYGAAPQRRDEAVERLAARGCRFLVFCRAGTLGFSSLAKAELPASLSQLCDEVPAAEFRIDVSSTQLRQQE